MALDSSASRPISAEDVRACESGASVGIVSGQARKTCPEIKDWCYLFLHNKQAEPFERMVSRTGRFRTFVHKTVRYRKSGRGVVEDSKPTVSGLVFIQGNADDITKWLQVYYPQSHLVNDCSSHHTAVIPDAVMQPFMRIVQADPLRIRFLLNPVSEYAEGHTLVEITTGALAGLRGYVIRIDRDRKLVMGVGDMTVAVGGVHKEHFENVEDFARERKASDGSQAGSKRELDALQESIDKSFYLPENLNDIILQSANIDLWRDRAEGYVRIGQTDKAVRILLFLLEEIGYYFASTYKDGALDLTAVKSSASEVAKRAKELTESAELPENVRLTLESGYDAQVIRHGYLWA